MSTPADGTIVDKEDIAHARFAIGLDIGEASVSIAINLTGVMWCLAVLSTPTKGDLFAPLEVAKDFFAELEMGGASLGHVSSKKGDDP